MKGRPGLALAAALLTMAPLTAACGAGLNAETLREGTTIDGANAQAGDLRVRNGYLAAPQSSIEFPAGSDIPVYLTVANIGSTEDTLTGASSPLGEILVQRGSSASASPAVDASPVAVAIPPGQVVNFGSSTGGAAGAQPGGAGAAEMVLSQVSKPVRIASFVPITLRFANSDEVTIQAPVGSGYGPGAGPSPTDEPASEESESSTPGH